MGFYRPGSVLGTAPGFFGAGFFTPGFADGFVAGGTAPRVIGLGAGFCGGLPTGFAIGWTAVREAGFGVTFGTPTPVVVTEGFATVGVARRR